MENEKIVALVLNALNEKKAKELKALKVGELTVLAEYFVIATASSSTHVRALADEVEEKLSENGCAPHHTEGKSTGWYVLDYGSVIVHIFTPKEREFYDLDRMWCDAESIDITDILETPEGD